MDTRAFLAYLTGRLQGDEEYEIRTFYRGGPRDGKPGPRAFNAAAAELAEVAAGLRGSIDGYYGVNPRVHQDGTKAGVSRVLFVHADIDDKLFGGSAVDALAAIEAFPFAPTVVVRTGGGYQCLWAIAALGATPANIALVEGIMVELYRIFGGADSVQDVSRVFRLPGTRNYKYPERPLVEVVRFEPANCYTLDDFLALCPPPVEVPRPPRPLLHFDDPSAEQMREMLGYIDPQPGYRDWVRVLAAIHSVFPGPEGEAIAEEWSPGTGGNSVVRKFKSFRRHASATNATSIGTIIYLAKQGGWQPPAPPQRPPGPSRPAPHMPSQEAPGPATVDPHGQAATVDVAALVAELAALRLEVAELRRALALEQAAKQKAERFNRALINFDRAKGIKKQKPIIKAALFVYHSKASRGEVDDEGWAPTTRAELAEVGATSLDAAGDSFGDVTSWGVGIEKRVVKEEYVEVDARGQAVVQSRPRILLRVNGETVDKLEELCAFTAPTKPGKASWGGKRDACPDCGSTNTHREVRVVCDECGHVSKPLADPHPITPADLRDELPVDEADERAPSVPPTPVIVPLRPTYPQGEVTYSVDGFSPGKRSINGETTRDLGKGLGDSVESLTTLCAGDPDARAALARLLAGGGEDEEEEADTWDWERCNWGGCTARLKIGQDRYCDFHQEKPHAAPPPRIPLIARAAPSPVAPPRPPAPPGTIPRPPQRLSWCLNYRGEGQGCQHRVGRRGDAYCPGCVAEGYVNGPGGGR